MAILEPVHVLEMDRASAKMECVRINATRSFAHLGPSGMALYTWQNGRWFGQSGQEIDPAIVPEEDRKVMTDVPVVVETRGPAVVATCEFCGEQMNRSEKEAHLINHVRETLGAAGRVPPDSSPVKEASPPPPPPVRQRVAAG